jgi:hypothetical protein
MSIIDVKIYTIKTVMSALRNFTSACSFIQRKKAHRRKTVRQLRWTEQARMSISGIRGYIIR